MDTVSIFEASVMLGLPEYLIRNFIKFGFNRRKLRTEPTASSERTEIRVAEVLSFQEHLNASIESEKRKLPPTHVKLYLKLEANGVCALCRQAKPNYEFAHIESWTTSHCNSPYNLLHLCLDCHRSYGGDTKLLRSLKEELLRRSSLLGEGPIYSCHPDLQPGDLVYDLEGVARTADALEIKRLPSGFLRAKLGRDRCTVQRAGVVVGLKGLVAGEYYCVSPDSPGKVALFTDFEILRDKSRPVYSLSVGRAESSTQLAIHFGVPIKVTC